MKTPSERGGEMIPFADSVEDDLGHAGELALHLSDKIADSTPRPYAYQSAVVFALDPSNPHIASAIAKAESPYAPFDAHEFRRYNIDRHRILLANTALGQFLRDTSNPRPHYTQSIMNPEQPFVYTERLTAQVDGAPKLVGAVQYAFDSEKLESLPDSDTMERLAREDGDIFRALGHTIQSLGERAHFLSRSLEMEPSVIPNTLALRWDIQDSQQLTRGDGNGRYEAYLDHTKEKMFTLFDEINEGRSKEPYKFLREIDIHDRGDGQSILIPLPPAYRFIEPEHPNSYKARMFGTNEIAPLIRKIIETQKATAARYYPHYPPNVRFAVDVGYVENSPSGLPAGKVLSDITKIPHAGMYKASFSDDAKKMITKFEQ